MLKEYTCIICPNGCTLEADIAKDNTIRKITGAGCRNGIHYVRQELTDPQRTVSSSVLVRHGELPLASVRLTKPIPKNRIFDVMACIKTVSLEAPVRAGDIIIPDILGLGSDVIATKDIQRRV